MAEPQLLWAILKLVNDDFAFSKALTVVGFADSDDPMISGAEVRGEVSYTVIPSQSAVAGGTNS